MMIPSTVALCNNIFPSLTTNIYIYNHQKKIPTNLVSLNGNTSLLTRHHHPFPQTATATKTNQVFISTMSTTKTKIYIVLVSCCQIIFPPASMRNNEALQLERSRRDKMAEFYNVLQSMVPNLFPKATRTRVVDETIRYIKSLEEVATALDSQKRAKELRRHGNSSVSITVSHRTAFFTLRIVSGHGHFTRVVEVFEKHRAEVLAATVVVASEDGYTNVTVTALLDGEESAERIKAELMTF